MDYSDIALQLVWAFTTDLALPGALGLLGVLASLLVGGASVAVAYFAWRTSEKATAIARDAAEAEQRRDERAIQRELNESSERYEQRLSDACADILAAYSDWQLERYKDPVQPPTAVMAAASRALMFAHSKDRQVLLNAMSAVTWSIRADITSGVAATTQTELLAAFSDWRWGGRNSEETAERIRANTFVDDSWRIRPDSPDKTA